MNKEVVDRINRLCASPTLYLERFRKLNKWTGPNEYFHGKTLDRLKSLKSPLEAVHDRQYQEYLYATLCAWGLHRKGDEDGRLVEFDEFCQELAALGPELRGLQSVHLDELARQDIVPTADRLWCLMDRMRLRPVNKPYLGVTSKALHHLLPGLVVPIDGRYTAPFFGWRSNKLLKSPRDMFFEVFPLLVDIAKRIKPQVGAYIGQPFYKSLPKVIDNAIVGLMSQPGGAIFEKNPIGGNARLSESSNTPLSGPKATDADRIRQKAVELYFEVARRRGDREVVIISEHLHSQLGLHNQYPNVCQALRGKKLQQVARAELINDEGPKASNTTRFIYRLL